HIIRSNSAGLRIIASDPVVRGNLFDSNVGPAISMDLASNPAIGGNVLTKNGVNGLAIDPGTLPENAVWDDPDIVYRLSGDLVVPLGKTLTIAPGQIVKVPVFVGNDLLVDGTLSAAGTVARPIIFTSDRDDAAAGDTNNDGPSTANNGDWNTIQFGTLSTG